ncbi:sugar phosphate nucleotidyltransferase [Oscillospiraceae bacterium PP1C4]
MNEQMNLSDFVISDTLSVIKAMEQLDKSSKGVLFICNGSDILEGCITDGDIRRFILRGGDLTHNIMNAANQHPKFCYEAEYTSDIDFQHLKCIPVVNEKKQIVSLHFSNETLRPHAQLNIPIVIMAGGKGTRLKPFTDVLPKPLIPIRDRTITEHIIDQFLQYDCDDFWMIVNHSKALIKAYFGELDKSYHLTFVDEEKPLGTGGGLVLLKGKMPSTFILSNCDVLIECDYAKAVAYHKEKHNIITVVCAVKNIVIPYGTVRLDNDGKIFEFSEKPEFSFLTSTGLYIIEPEFLSMIPEDTLIHITDVIQMCIDQGKSVGAFPVSQNAWYDMGQMEEMEKMIKWKATQY